MDKKITIKYVIPVSNENENLDKGIKFYCWIPSEDDALEIENQKIKSKIWVDDSCIDLPPGSPQEIKNWVNVSVEKVYLEITLIVDSILAQFIYDERDRRYQKHHGIQPDDERYPDLNKEYEQIGFDTMNHALKIYNNFVAYVRNIKGQYWLEQWEFHNDNLAGYTNHFNCMVKIDDDDWVKWIPSTVPVIHFNVKSDELYLRKDDWTNARNYIERENRTTLALELIANSQSLLDQGLRRSALIEAVSALERAIFDFGKNPKTEELKITTDNNRIDIQRLHAQMKHLGFSGTLRYLIPLFFDEQTLSTETLRQCYDAIERRGNIVHNGARDIQEDIAGKLIQAIKKCCQILNSYTKQP